MNQSAVQSLHKILVWPLVCALAAVPLTARPQQVQPNAINIVIVEGEGAINNVQQRIAREPIVRVEDENRRPVAGATVVFILPESGAGGSFPEGARSLTVVTDNQGQAVAKGFVANDISGKYQIQIEAAYRDLSATSTINQANAVLTAPATTSGGAAAGGVSGKLIAILAIAGAAVAGGVVAATRGNGNGNGGTLPPAPTPTVITPGTPSVGGP